MFSCSGYIVAPQLQCSLLCLLALIAVAALYHYDLILFIIPMLYYSSPRDFLADQLQDAFSTQEGEGGKNGGGPIIIISSYIIIIICEHLN